MAEPVCAQKAPYGVELAAGDYSWCACGLSKKQPFCDGSHKTTEFKPLKFSIAHSTRIKKIIFCEKNGEEMAGIFKRILTFNVYISVIMCMIHLFHYYFFGNYQNV